MYVWRAKCAISENKMPLNQAILSTLCAVCVLLLWQRHQRQISSTPSDREWQLNWILLL